jgi:hypothetical protein
MGKVRILIVAASTYQVDHNGQSITMVSTAMGAKALHADVVECKNVDAAIRAVRSAYDRVLATNADQAFTTLTRCIGRKIAHFDDYRAALQPTHVPAI